MKIIRLDGGAEFGAGDNGSLEAKSFWREKCIIHTIVPPGVHAQNGRVERPHLTILQSIRTGLPGMFWAEAALYGCIIGFQIAQISFPGIAPQAQQTKPLCSIVLAVNADLETTATSRTLGTHTANLSTTYKAFKVWDIVAGKCRIARAVVFGKAPQTPPSPPPIAMIRQANQSSLLKKSIPDH